MQFGPKTWCKETVNISEKLTSQEDRRKFRQGLKCNIDFLNQLNLHDLTKNFLTGKQDINSLHKSSLARLGDIFECLKNIPLIDILKLIDREKAEKICSAMDKIGALAHFSQSMGNYFARDDSLDPALSIACQALMGNFDIEYILRKRGHFSVTSLSILSFEVPVRPGFDWVHPIPKKSWVEGKPAQKTTHD